MSYVKVIQKCMYKDELKVMQMYRFHFNQILRNFMCLIMLKYHKTIKVMFPLVVLYWIMVHLGGTKYFSYTLYFKITCDYFYDVSFHL